METEQENGGMGSHGGSDGAPYAGSAMRPNGGSDGAPDAGTPTRPRRLLPRTTLGWIGLGFLAALLAVLLLVDFHFSFDTAQRQSGQSMGSASGTPRTIGDNLQVYLDEGADRPGLKAALRAAVQESELPFADVTFVADLPAEAMANPVLVVKVLDDGGFWTPVYASRQMTVRFYYAQGWRVDREAIQNPGGPTRTVSVGADVGDCAGACARGERDLTLGARSVGLISLPHMQSYLAKELAKEAVLLVKGGLPANLNPERWLERAGELARKQEPLKGSWSTFQRIPDCRGGVLFMGEVGENGAWSLLYYDAARDELTEQITHTELAERAGAKLGVTGLQFGGSPGFGGSDREFSLHFLATNQGNLRITIPPGQCGLSNLEFNR